MRKAAGLALLLILLASISGCAGNVPADSAPQQTEPTVVHEEAVAEAENIATSEESSDTPVTSLEPNWEETMESKRNPWSNRTGDFFLSVSSAGFLGWAQIDGQAFFAYTESETMQRRRGL